MNIETEASTIDASEADGPESIKDMIRANLEADHENGPSEGEHTDTLGAPEDEDDAEDEADHDNGPSEDEAEDEDEGTSEDDTSEAEPAQKRAVADDDVVTVEVDGQTREVSIRDLRRLAGQEASLTRKTQEATETKKKADDVLSMYEASLDRHFRRAQENYKQYEGVNFTLLSQEVSYDKLKELTEGEARARAELDYFRNELVNHLSVKRQHEAANAEEHRAVLVRAVEQTRAEVYDPTHGIKGFTPEHANALEAFVIQDYGLLSEDLVSFVSHPRGAKIVRALHDLYAAKRGERALETKTKVPAKNPVKVVKSQAANVADKSDTLSRAMKRLDRDNSSENIQAAIKASLFS